MTQALTTQPPPPTLRPMRAVDPETRGAVVRLLQEGHTAAEAGRIAGCSAPTAVRIANQEGLGRRPGRPDGEGTHGAIMQSECLCWHFAGATTAQIAGRLKLSVRSVQNYLREIE